MLEFSSVVAYYAAIIFALNLVLWAIVFFLLRQIGAYDPRFDALWPRLPWRPLWRLYVKFREWWEEVFRMGKGQTAGWNSVPSNLGLLYRNGDVLLGRARHWFGGWIQPMGFKAQRHLMCISGSGGGKTVFLITLLAMFRRDQSAFAIDPKGKITKTVFEPQESR